MEILMFNADKSTNYGDWKAGDVIAVCPDGWQWSDAERTHALWVIIIAPITQIEADALIVPYATPQFIRKYRIDPTGLVANQVLSQTDFASRVSLR